MLPALAVTTTTTRTPTNLETSILLAAHPVYVRDGWQSSDYIASDRRYLTTLGKSAYTPNGVIGYPSRASAEKAL